MCQEFCQKLPASYSPGLVFVRNSDLGAANIVPEVHLPQGQHGKGLQGGPPIFPWPGMREEGVNVMYPRLSTYVEDMKQPMSFLTRAILYPPAPVGVVMNNGGKGLLPLPFPPPPLTMPLAPPCYSFPAFPPPQQCPIMEYIPNGIGIGPMVGPIYPPFMSQPPMSTSPGYMVSSPPESPFLATPPDSPTDSGISSGSGYDYDASLYAQNEVRVEGITSGSGYDYDGNGNGCCIQTGVRIGITESHCFPYDMAIIGELQRLLGLDVAYDTTVARLHQLQLGYGHGHGHNNDELWKEFHENGKETEYLPDENDLDHVLDMTGKLHLNRAVPKLTNKEKHRYRSVQNGCVFCRANGESWDVWTSHVTHVKGVTSCPVLRSYVCPICGMTGDKSHTIKYCPKNNGVMDGHVHVHTNRNAAGLLGRYTKHCRPKRLFKH